MDGRHVRSPSDFTIASIDYRDSSCTARIIRTCVQYVMRTSKMGTYALPHARTVLPAAYGAACLCFVLGIAILHGNSRVLSHESSYGNYSLGNININFELKDDFKGQVYLYYKLSEFPINHRRMQKDSYCIAQLNGENDTGLETSSCSPNRTKKTLYDVIFPNIVGWENFANEKEKKLYAPMGALPNIMFNDTFILYYVLNGASVEVPLSTEGILSEAYREMDRSTNTNCSSEMFINTVKPRNWPKHICNMTDGYRNVDFLVWLRPVGYSTFKKINRIVNHSKDALFRNGLPKGNYTMKISNNYQTGGCGSAYSKSFILMRPSWYGHRDEHLHVICFVVGVLYLCAAVAITIVHIYKGQTLEEIAVLEEEKKEK